jgi:AraC-like DNA-binding protein
MQYMQPGSFYGSTGNMLRLDNIIITESEYEAGRIQWHYHENAYFTLVLKGGLADINKTQEHRCLAGTLLFHYSEEPHFNVITKRQTQSLHIELDKNLITALAGIPGNKGSLEIADPGIKILFHQVYRETKINDAVSPIAVESCILKAVAAMVSAPGHTTAKAPRWVKTVKDVIHSHAPGKLTLGFLAAQASIHPVHLSRDFSKYFHCSLGSYTRKIKIEKAMLLLYNKNLSLTGIAFDCGFADQSHFVRCFKQVTGITPSGYRKVMLR